MTVANLRKELEARGLDSKGLKGALVDRLQPVLAAEEAAGAGGDGAEEAAAPAAAAAAPEPEPEPEVPNTAPAAAAGAEVPPAFDVAEIKRRAAAISAKATTDLAGKPDSGGDYSRSADRGRERSRERSRERDERPPTKWDASATGAAAGGGKDPAAIQGGPPSRPGDWPCPQCHNNCFASRSICFKCGAPRPAQYDPAGTGLVGDSIKIKIAGYEGRIIGKGGSVIREIQERTGAHIQIFKDVGICDVSGTGAQAAAEEIRRICAECMELRETMASGGNTAAGYGGPPKQAGGLLLLRTSTLSARR